MMNYTQEPAHVSTYGQNSGAAETKKDSYTFQHDTVFFIPVLQNVAIQLY